jgi:hypothetical protein
MINLKNKKIILLVVFLIILVIFESYVNNKNKMSVQKNK